MPRAQHCIRCGTALALTPNHEGIERLTCTAEACGWIHYDNPTPVVAGLVEHEGDVLLVRNKGWPETWYGLVSGFLERKEEPELGMLRELREELGLDGEIIGLIGVYPFAMRNELIVAYHLKAEGEVVVGDELADYKRVPPRKLKPWPMGTGLAVRDWLEARGLLDDA
ncbi:MAG: NUDIX domain-containing protein [Myxococcota bacterium]